MYKKSQHYISSFNAMTDTRSDEACQWITKEVAFEDWAFGAHGILTMYGVVGCGKTATASYVAKYLSKEAQSPVLIYHCTQQQEDELRLILCSLTYQLLQSKVALKKDFKDWSNAREATSLDPPANQPTVLWEFLGNALQQSKEQVFIVLDGLDECEAHARRTLLGWFRDLVRDGALLKIFVSSRQEEDIAQTLNDPGTVESQFPLFHIEMKPNEQRDRLLTKHLVSIHMKQKLDDKTQDLIVEQLVKRAGGSAIWLKMATASLANARNEHGIKRCLEILETSPTLVDWYQRLLNSAESGPDIDILERALETLAVAKRPLSIVELSCAAFIDDNDDSLSRLNEDVSSIDLLQLLRPFVASLDESSEDGAGSVRVRLVHASLRDLLLKARPSEWRGMAAQVRLRKFTQKEQEQRIQELNELLMGRCVKYLLLDSSEVESPSEETDESSDGATQDAEGDDTNLGYGDMFVDPEVQKKAQIQALVSQLPFYDYAASHWAAHLAASGNGAPAELQDRARKLLDLNNSDCVNWVDFVRADKEAAAEAFPRSSEATTLAAYYGLTATLSEILGKKSVTQSTKDEALFWASHQGRDSIVKLLLQDGADANQGIVDGHTALTVAASHGFVGCVQTLLADQRTDVNIHGSRDRTALWLAASSGHEDICAILLDRDDCRPDDEDVHGKTPFFSAVDAEHLALVKKLAAHPGVDVNHRSKNGRTALSCAAAYGNVTSLKLLLNLKDVDVNLPDKDGKSPLLWAALNGHTACVDALLQNANVDKTAKNCCNEQKNAYHYACTTGKHEVLLCLLKHHLAGRDAPDKDLWTPLGWAIGISPACTRSLLAAGQVDLEHRDHEGKTVLSLAAQWSPSIEFVEILLRHGASLETRDDEEKTPYDVAASSQRKDPLQWARNFRCG